MALYAGHGERVAAFAEHWIVQTKGRWAGEALHLEPWQREVLDEFYLVDENGDYVYREALLGVPRKNGKSTLTAAIALHGLLAANEGGPEVYAAAASKDQARIVFDQARKFVESSPRLRDWLTPMRNAIVCESNGGVFRVLSSDAPLQHGLNPSMVVIDELWAHRDPELYYALTTGQLARSNPMIVSITTAGFDEETIAYQVYSYGRELEQRGLDAMRKARFFFRWYQADPSVEIDDEKEWRRANPSSWVSMDDLRLERQRLPEHVFRRLHLNQWTASEEAWLPVGAWEACVGGGAIPDGATVSLGVDLGLKHDCAAIGIAWARPDGKVVVNAEIHHPPTGGTLSIPMFEEAIRDKARKYDVRHVLFDPWRFVRSATILEDEGLPMIEFPQTNARMAPASQRLYDAIVDRRVEHPNDPELNRHVAAGVTMDTERGWRLAKRRAKHFIDGLIAVLMAYEAAVAIPEEPKINVADYRVVGLEL